MKDNDTQSITSDIAEQAVNWHLELQELCVSEATLAEWMSWRQAHPIHERAWQRAEAFAQRLSDIRGPHQRPLAHAALRPTLSRRVVIKQLGVLLAAGVGAWALKDTTLLQDSSAEYYSRIGERRRITLADDTQVQLNTDSAIKVMFDQETRRIRLLRGEMLVTRDNMADSRLLTVESAEGRLETALARFSVRQRAGLTLVSVYHGMLILRPSLQQAQPVVIKAGVQLSFNEQGVLARQTVALAPPAWSQGMLVAQGQRLADFLDELGRYRRGHLACDPVLADRRVSGTFPLASTDRIIFAVADTLQLDVQQLTRFWVTLKPRAA